MVLTSQSLTAYSGYTTSYREVIYIYLSTRIGYVKNNFKNSSIYIWFINDYSSYKNIKVIPEKQYLLISFLLLLHKLYNLARVDEVSVILFSALDISL